jgi:hypothetical protein
MEFGTPMFYAVSLGRIHIVEALDQLGVSVTNVCDSYMKLTPAYYATLSGDPSVAAKIDNLIYKEQKAGDLFVKNFLKHRARRKYLRMKKSAIIIQKHARGLADRIMVRLVRAGAITLDSRSQDSGDSGSMTGSRGGSTASRSKASKGKKAKGKKEKDKEKGKLKAVSGSQQGSVVGSASLYAEDSLDSLSMDGTLSLA